MVRSAAWKRVPSSRQNVLRASPLRAISASSGAVRADVLKPYRLLDGDTESPDEVLVEQPDADADVGVEAVDLRCRGDVDAVVAGQHQDAAGAGNVGLGEDFGRPAIAADQADSSENGVVGLGLVVNDDEGGAGFFQVFEDVPADAAEPAQDEMVFHGAMGYPEQETSPGAAMNLDAEICYCFHVTRRKLVNFVPAARPRVVSQLSECGGAGTGCGWCIPFIKQIYQQECGGLACDELEKLTPEEYERLRAEYVREGKGKPPPGATPLPK